MKPTAPELLLDCLGRRSAKEVKISLEALSAADLESLIEETAAHEMAGILLARLEAMIDGPMLPASANRRLQGLAVASALRTRSQFEELRSVLERLKQHHVRVIVLKGAYLAQAVYESVGLRAMCDADLLVPVADLSAAGELMVAMGCRKLSRPQIEADPDAFQHLPPLVTPGGLRVELHRSIERPTSPFCIDVGTLWARAVTARIAGIEVLGLSVEDLLLHLCLHTSYHHRFRIALKHLYDIPATLTRFRGCIDWGRLVHTAGEWKAQRFAFATLALSNDMLGAEVPSGVLEELKPSDAGSCPLGVVRECLLSATGPSLPPTLQRVYEAGQVREKCLIVARSLIPSNRALQEMYRLPSDSRTTWLYYPVRWWDLLRRWSGFFFQLGVKSSGARLAVRRGQLQRTIDGWVEAWSSADLEAQAVDPPRGSLYRKEE